MIQLNLLPDLKKEFLKAQKTKGLVIGVSILVTLSAIGLSALLFVYVTFVQQLQINLATSDIEKKEAELKAVPDINKYLSIQNQLASVTALHEQKGQYSRLFDFMGRLNPSPPNNISLSSLQISTSDKAVIFGGSSESFESLNIFVDTLKNAQVKYKSGGEGDFTQEAMFEQVLVQSSGLAKINNKSIVTFVVRATYREPVFDIRHTNVSAEVPSITTTPSATQAPVPQQLFKGAEN